MNECDERKHSCHEMPPVLMWLEDSTVPVTLDSLGMVPSVRVRMTALFVS